MLKKSVLIASRPIVDQANWSRVALVPRPGTPLSMLAATTVQLVLPEPATDKTTLSDDQPDALNQYERILMQLSMRADSEGTETHGVELGEIGRVYSDKVAASLNYARNVVNPMVRTIVKEARDRESALLNPYGVIENIVPIRISEAYTDGLLETLLEKDRRRLPEARPVPVELAETLMADMTPEVFFTIIKTNNAVFDAKVVETLQNEYDDWEFNSVLSTGLLTWDVNQSDIARISNHDILAAYLFLNGILYGNHPGLDIKAFTGDELARIRAAQAYFGFNLNEKIDRYTKAINDGMLIAPQGGWNGVYVFEDTYLPWLENGGAPEAIIGFMKHLAGKPVTYANQADLIKRPQNYIDIHDRQVRTLTANNRVEFAATVNALIKRHLFDFAMEEYGEEPLVRREFQDNIIEILSKSPYYHNVDLTHHVLKVVCHVTCKDRNNAYDVLQTMSGYLDDNPEAPVTEAALVAAAKIVGRWAASQVTVAGQ